MIVLLVLGNSIAKIYLIATYIVLQEQPVEEAERKLQTLEQP